MYIAQLNADLRRDLPRCTTGQEDKCNTNYRLLLPRAAYVQNTPLIVKFYYDYPNKRCAYLFHN